MAMRSIPLENRYRIRDPKNFYAAMRADIELLHKNRRYVSMTTLIFCCMDALAAGPGNATKGKFESFVSANFPDLASAIERTFAENGTKHLYEAFRNGFAHLRAPKPSYAICEDHELGGDWVAVVSVDGLTMNALNVDRLAREFLAVLDGLESAQGTPPEILGRLSL